MNQNKEIKINKFHFKKNKKMILFYIATSLFIALTILTLTNVISPLDNTIESFTIGIRNDKLTNMMIIITNLSRAYFLISASIIILFVLKNKKHALLIIINLTIVFLSSQLFKFVFHRARPDGEHIVRALGYSYPSGHAMVSMAYFGFILYLINKKTTKKMHRIALTIITSLIIFLIGFSRIYLGVHYTSDVLAGYLLATAYLVIFLTSINKEEKQWK